MVDPVVISVLKGRPAPDDVAALVIALLAREPEQGAASQARSRWRASGLRDRSWQAPATWSAGMRRWTRPRP